MPLVDLGDACRLARDVVVRTIQYFARRPAYQVSRTENLGANYVFTYSYNRNSLSDIQSH